MIKASKFSKTIGCYLDDAINRFKVPVNHEKQKLFFLSGDMTAYGNQDFKMPQVGYEIVQRHIEQTAYHGYTHSSGTQEAREAVLKHICSQVNYVDYTDVVLTHGANMGLFYSILSFCNPGDNILIPEPSYPFYQKVAKAYQVEARPYNLQPEKQWEIDLNYLQSLIDQKTKYIWIVNPSNPCSSIFSKKHQIDIINLAQKNNLPLVCDEVYWNQSFENDQFISFGQILTDAPIILIGGMEKMFLVPGWSLSWMIFVDKHKRLKKIKESVQSLAQMFSHPCRFMMNAFPDLINELTADFCKKKIMPYFENNYYYVYDKIKKIKGLRPIQAQGTFYLSVLIDLEQFEDFKCDYDFLQALLNEENIFILSLSCFGGNVNGFRLIDAAKKEDYDEFVKRLEAFCSRHYKK